MNGYEYSILSGVMGVIIIVIIIAFAFAIFEIACRWKMYKKAGKDGWEAIIPFYSDYVLVQIAGLNWWWFLILILPTLIAYIAKDDNLTISILASLASLLASININYNISKKIHKDEFFAVLMVIFPAIMYPVIALTSSIRFDKSVVVSNNGLFNDDSNKNSNNNNSNANNMNTNTNANTNSTTNNTNTVNNNVNSVNSSASSVNANKPNSTSNTTEDLPKENNETKEEYPGLPKVKENPEDNENKNI